MRPLAEGESLGRGDGDRETKNAAPSIGKPFS